MDHRNVLIASSQRYKWAGHYYNVRAMVKDRKTGKCGYVDINRNGEVVRAEYT